MPAQPPTGSQSPIPPVPSGPTTKTGYAVSAAGFVLALIAFMSGDTSDPTVATLAIGGVAALSYLVTQIGRYIQARELAANVARPPVNVYIMPSGGPPPNGAAPAAAPAADDIVDALRALVHA